ncbi:hypothetical protein DB30_01179 [Enhygromyxa salina]|uniref:Uncharacterized protein n=1 Tax=Enhygromyxa salina TaxID=215803 RepID=A0A0C1Z4M3_9BACT|nr:hypothetical protein DB30_01179 [Enhygromyxa salina]
MRASLESTVFPVANATDCESVLAWRGLACHDRTPWIVSALSIVRSCPSHWSA